MNKHKAWRADSFTDRSLPFFEFTAAQGDVLAKAASVEQRLDMNEAASEDLAAALAPTLEAAAEEVVNGCGFAILKGFPIDALDDGVGVQKMERAFWLAARIIGRPDEQDIDGKRLHHVLRSRDSGDFHFDNNLRAYQTDVEIGFHGDGSDALFFLCLRQAPEGGQSRLVSAERAFQSLESARPDLASVLKEPVHFDARGQRADSAPTQFIPIVAEHNAKRSFLYKRGYIELAQRFDHVAELTRDQIDAMDAFDAVLNDPANVLEFRLQRGEAILVDNYTILHARTAFEDHPDPGRHRHFLRIWMSLNAGGPVAPAYADTREFGQSFEFHDRK